MSMKLSQPRFNEMHPYQPFHRLGKLRVESHLVDSEVLDMLLRRVHLYVSHSHVYLFTMTWIHHATHLFDPNMSNVWIQVIEGPLYMHTKSLENLRGLKNLPKAVPWEMKFKFCNRWALKLSVEWKWTLSGDCNIHSSLGPQHNTLILLGANDNEYYCHNP